MPPRWPRKPDRNDPAYRRLEDRINFAVHVAFFGTCNSGVWFVQTLKSATWSWSVWLTGIWFAGLMFHLLYIAVIADYTQGKTTS